MVTAQKGKTAYQMQLQQKLYRTPKRRASENQWL